MDPKRQRSPGSEQEPTGPAERQCSKKPATESGTLGLNHNVYLNSTEIVCPMQLETANASMTEDSSANSDLSRFSTPRRRGVMGARYLFTIVGHGARKVLIPATVFTIASFLVGELAKLAGSRIFNALASLGETAGLIAFATGALTAVLAALMNSYRPFYFTDKEARRASPVAYNTGRFSPVFPLAALGLAWAVSVASHPASAQATSPLKAEFTVADCDRLMRRLQMNRLKAEGFTVSCNGAPSTP